MDRHVTLLKGKREFYVAKTKKRKKSEENKPKRKMQCIEKCLERYNPNVPSVSCRTWLWTLYITFLWFFLQLPCITFTSMQNNKATKVVVQIKNPTDRLRTILPQWSPFPGDLGNEIGGELKREQRQFWSEGKQDGRGQVRQRRERVRVDWS